MITEWMDETTGAEVRELMKINSGLQGEIGGYGLKQRVERLIGLLQATLYPSIYYDGKLKKNFLSTIVTQCYQKSAMLLYDIAKDTLPGVCGFADENSPCQLSGDMAEWITRSFMESLPKIAETLSTDIQAAYDGDPAARSKEEVLLAYPGFEAILIYRLAHRLFELRLPIVPRMMTEYAHHLTAIDIHPGATIGEYFFIDHGSGVVIGETCRIGRHVKLYQGVTLGAKSFELDEAGHPVKGGKRHPNVEDHVIIYAGATVLGGDTVIGEGSVIGGSVWLTHSVPAGSTIYNSTQQ